MLKKHFFPLSIIVLSIIGILLAYALTEEFYFMDLPQYDGQRAGIFTPISSQVCGAANSYFSCESVSKSRYAVLFGVPLAIYGLMFYLMTLFIALIGWFVREAIKRLMMITLFWTAGLGLCIDIGLFFLSYFQIKALCPLCLFTYGITLLLFATTWIYLSRNRIRPLHPAIGFEPEDRSSKKFFPAAGSLILILILITATAAGLCFAVNRSLIRGRINYITVNQEKENQRIVAAFSLQKPEQLLLPALSVYGEQGAPVTIVEVSDFLCPYCAYSAPIIDKLIEKNPHTLRVLFVNFPLDKNCNHYMQATMHQGACELARGAICAATQDKLRDYLTTAFAARRKNPTTEDVRWIAASIGMDLNALDQCLESPDTEETLQWQIEADQNQKIDSTPTIFINGKRFKGRVNEETLQRIIDLEVKRIEDEKEGLKK